jgi:PKD repeat protein
MVKAGALPIFTIRGYQMPFARLRGKTRACLLAGAAAALLVLVAMLGGVPTRAQSVGNCVPTTTPNVVNCTFTSTTAIAPGGTMEIQVTNPSGAFIQNIDPLPPLGCAVTAGKNTPILTISCAIASLGMQSGITFTESIGGIPSPATTLFVTQSVTYNANGAAPQVPPPSTSSGTCDAISAGSSNVAFKCINVPASQTVSGGTLTMVVSAPPAAPGATGSLTLQVTGICVTGTANPTCAGAQLGALGSCFESAPFLPQPPSALGASGTATVTCATGQSTQPCPQVTPSCPTANPSAPLTIVGVATNTNAALSPPIMPVETTVSNANGPTSSTIAVPEVLTIGVCSVSGATLTCINTPGETTQPGQQLVFAITAAAGQTIQITSDAAPPAPPPLGCTRSFPQALPSDVSFPEGTIPLTYSCSSGPPSQSAPPAAYTVTGTIVNGVGGIPSEITSVNTQGPPLGVPVPTTNAVTFTVSGTTGPSATPGTPVNPGTPTAVPPATTTAVPTTGPGTFCSGASCTSNSNCVNPPNAFPPAAPTTGSPPAVSSGAPYAGTQGQPLQLKGVATPAPTPPGGKPITIALCTWDFGDGTLGSHFLSPTHVYGSAGLYTATLTVIDSTGQSTTVTTLVGILASPPLCQNPLVPTWTGLSPCTGPACPAASFNNQCAPLCPLTGATLLPNQCPGPATGNAIWTTGPFNVQVDDPVTVTVNTTLPATSSLLAGAAVKFDFGDGAVVTNAPQGQQQSQSASTTTSTFANTQTTTTTAAGTTIIYPFPPSMQAVHAYTQPGNYTIKVTMTYSDGTTAFNQTQAPVSGQPPGFPTSPLISQPQLTSNGAVGGAPAQPAGAPQLIATGVPLAPGCNNVTLTFPDGTPASAVAAAVQGAPVTAIYETPPNAPPLAYFPSGSASGQASNLATVQHGDAATICVSGAATLNQPPS